MLLAIDTSGGTSVAVVDRTAVLAEHSSADTRRHAELIGDLIAAALTDSGARPLDLAGVAVGMGPGPFTGLRVGIAAARAFALGIHRPVVPVVSHDALAFGEPGPLLVVTDARRREVHWSRYTRADDLGLPVRSEGPEIARPDDVVDDGTPRIEHAAVSAGRLGLLAEALLAAGRPPAGDEALYLRAPDVTMSRANSSGRRVT